MEAYESIKSRQSFRGFLSKPITKDIMKKIVEVAGNCPSYANTQPWEIIVVSGGKKEELSKKLYKLAQVHAPISPDFPLPTCWPPKIGEYAKEHGLRKLNTLGIERSDKKERERLRLMNFEFYGAPYAIFLFMDGSLGSWSLFDMGLFTQNLILSAYSQGVGSCIQASVTEYAAEIKKFLHISQEKKLVICIAMGYPDPDAELNAYRSIKKQISEFFCWYE